MASHNACQSDSFRIYKGKQANVLERLSGTHKAGFFCSSLIFDRGEKKKLMKVMNVHMKITSCTLNKPEKKKISFFCL